MELPETVGGVDIYWLGHASVKLVDTDGTTVYIDPWSEVMQEQHEPAADIIISTHDDRDHFDVKAIQAVKKDDTVVVCHPDSRDAVPEDVSYKTLDPGRSVTVRGTRIRGIHAYNTDKFESPDVPYHAKGDGYGALFALDGTRFYHAADTDPVPEMGALADEDIDVAFLPVGGTYTMDQDEAIEAVQLVRPRLVVPIHYGTLEETSADTERFEQDVRDRTDAEPLVLERQVP
ncbi:MAG: MBL fold metallo-hydrolase [Candidatus Nanohaloarchaea archaeon]|nr:MBL fold metallo-hydrolase [Candidatus Nanohaloarchaea archaeon]